MLRTVPSMVKSKGGIAWEKGSLPEQSELHLSHSHRFTLKSSLSVRWRPAEDSGSQRHLIASNGPRVLQLVEGAQGGGIQDRREAWTKET